MNTKKNKLFLLFAALMAAVLAFLYTQQRRRHELDREGKIYFTKVKLDRLLTETQRLFKDRRGLTEDSFWATAGGKAAWKDGWGNPFRLDTINRNEFYWESSGPDEIFGTTDDIREPVWPIEPPVPPWGVADPIVDKE